MSIKGYLASLDNEFASLAPIIKDYEMLKSICFCTFCFSLCVKPKCFVLGMFIKTMQYCLRLESTLHEALLSYDVLSEVGLVMKQ